MRYQHQIIHDTRILIVSLHKNNSKCFINYCVIIQEKTLHIQMSLIRSTQIFLAKFLYSNAVVSKSFCFFPFLGIKDTLIYLNDTHADVVCRLCNLFLHCVLQWRVSAVTITFGKQQRRLCLDEIINYSVDCCLGNYKTRGLCGFDDILLHDRYL